MGLAFTNKVIDKYFRFLRHLDNGSKKKLIIKLTESMEENKKKMVSLRDLAGAWEDSRDSDEIIKEIRSSRVDKRDNIDF